VALALAVAGCGADEETAPSAPATPPADTGVGESDTGTLPNTGAPEDSVAAAEWADEVCTSVGAWQSDVEASRGNLQAALTDVASVEDARNELTTFLTDVVEQTDELLADVEAAGTPAVEAGDEVRDTLQTSLTQVRETFEEARADAEALSTDDPGAFVSGAQELATSIGLGVSGAVQAIQDVSAQPGLAEAISQSSACDELAG
jgi:hypothetical protein